MTEADTFPSHVALDGSVGGMKQRIDIVPHENGKDCLVVISTGRDTILQSLWTETDLVGPYRDDLIHQHGFADSHDLMPERVMLCIDKRYREMGGMWPGIEPAAYWYIVEGRGPFPKDMLRRDRSRAASEEDQWQIDADLESPLYRVTVDGREKVARRRVRLVTNAKHGTPNTDRWESFGWRVVEVHEDMWWARLSEADVGGRPRQHPHGTTNADRAKESLKSLKASGGAKRTFALSGNAISALNTLREHGADPSDTAVVERILIEAAERLAGEVRA